MTNEWDISSQEFLNLLDSIRDSFAVGQRDLHRAAVAAFAQCANGNTSWFRNLLDALPGVAKVRDLTAWAHAFSNGKCIVKASKGSVDIALAKGWMKADFNIPEANGTAFWLFKPETKGQQPLTLQDLGEWLAKRASGKVKADEDVAKLCAEFATRVEMLRMEKAGWVRKVEAAPVEEAPTAPVETAPVETAPASMLHMLMAGGIGSRA